MRGQPPGRSVTYRQVEKSPAAQALRRSPGEAERASPVPVARTDRKPGGRCGRGRGCSRRRPPTAQVSSEDARARRLGTPRGRGPHPAWRHRRRKHRAEGAQNLVALALALPKASSRPSTVVADRLRQTDEAVPASRWCGVNWQRTRVARPPNRHHHIRCRVQRAPAVLPTGRPRLAEDLVPPAEVVRSRRRVAGGARRQVLASRSACGRSGRSGTQSEKSSRSAASCGPTVPSGEAALPTRCIWVARAAGNQVDASRHSTTPSQERRPVASVSIGLAVPGAPGGRRPPAWRAGDQVEDHDASVNREVGFPELQSATAAARPRQQGAARSAALRRRPGTASGERNTFEAYSCPWKRQQELYCLPAAGRARPALQFSVSRAGEQLTSVD